MIDISNEIEKRKLKDKLDHNRIFTSITNETRLESISMIKKYKQEIKNNNNNHYNNNNNNNNSNNSNNNYNNNFSNETKARYLKEIEEGNEIFKEIENILQRALPTNKIRNEKTLEHSKSVNNGIKLQSQSHLKRNKSIASNLKKTNNSNNINLPPLEERYGNITQSWQKGPIDIPKDRYFDLNDNSIYGESQDPRARQLKQQTKCLMNSLTTMSKQARIHDVCRRRVVENSQENGDDHVVEALDQFLPGDNSQPGQGAAILQLAMSQLTYRKRKARRRVNGRIDEVWEILQAPASSKLGFKLLSESISPHILTDRLATQRDNHHNNHNNQHNNNNHHHNNNNNHHNNNHHHHNHHNNNTNHNNQHHNNNNHHNHNHYDENDPNVPEPVSLIVLLEKLVDCIHGIDLFNLLLKMWIFDESLPRVFSSNILMQPLIDLLRSIGINKGAKRTADDLSEWLMNMLEAMGVICNQLFQDILVHSTMLNDRNLENFLNQLQQEVEKMVKLKAKPKDSNENKLNDENNNNNYESNNNEDDEESSSEYKESWKESSNSPGVKVITVETSSNQVENIRKRSGLIVEGEEFGDKIKSNDNKDIVQQNQSKGKTDEKDVKKKRDLTKKGKIHYHSYYPHHNNNNNNNKHNHPQNEDGIDNNEIDSNQSFSNINNTDLSSTPQPIVVVNPKNIRSTRVRQRLLPITEVVDISQLEKFHCQKPNTELVNQASKRLQESIRERKEEFAELLAYKSPTKE